MILSIKNDNFKMNNEIEVWSSKILRYQTIWQPLVMSGMDWYV